MLTRDDLHRYWLDRKELLGVTSALADVGYIDGSWYTEESRDRGTYVHQLIAADIAGTLDEWEYDPRLQGYLDAARAFRRDSQFTAKAVERQLADPVIGIAGTPDLVGYGFGKPTIVDFKTGAAARHHRLQLAAYRHLVQTQTPPLLPEVFIEGYAVYLASDGTYKVGDKIQRTDWAVMRAVITVAQDKRAA